MKNDQCTIGREAPAVHTTIGDLVEAITEIALEAGRTEKEGYALAAITLEKILREREMRELRA
jgi:hypothetical protein